MLIVLALAACDTNPASSVDSTAATLNASGSCAKGLSGTWIYQLRDTTMGTGWKYVGERKFFNCDEGWASPMETRVEQLAPGHRYQFRIDAAWNIVGSGSGGAYFDANGTANGTNYDAFTTPDIQNADASGEFPERFYTSDPLDGSAIASSCRVKEITNVRRGKTLFGTEVFNIRLTTAWKYCSGGDIVKMYPAGYSCNVTWAGTISGFKCLDQGQKIRAVNNGGSPEHGAYTYSFRIQQQVPGVDVPTWSAVWCATNQISGSGAHKRTGSCDIQPW